MGKCVYKGIIKQCFPSHDDKEIQALRGRVRVFHPTRTLEDIRRYFGEKIALYFAWTLFYTRWLLSAGIVGLVIGILSQCALYTFSIPTLTHLNLLRSIFSLFFLFVCQVECELGEWPCD